MNAVKSFKLLNFHTVYREIIVSIFIFTPFRAPLHLCHWAKLSLGKFLFTIIERKHKCVWANLILGIYIMFEHINAIVSGQIYDRFVQGNIRSHFNFACCQLANLRLGEFYSLSYLNITKSCLGKLKTV